MSKIKNIDKDLDWLGFSYTVAGGKKAGGTGKEKHRFHVVSGVLINIYNWLSGEKNNWCVIFANYYGVNTSTVGDLKSPIWSSLTKRGRDACKHSMWVSTSSC